MSGDARLAPVDAAVLISERFGVGVVTSDDIWRDLIQDLAQLGIAGGAVYDALIALTARSVDGALVTRDTRAAATYARLRVSVEMI